MAERLRLQRKQRESRDGVREASRAEIDATLAASSARPLDQGARAKLEPSFGYDFSQVRVHTDDQAASSAESLNARAYTVGSDIVFGAGAYAPASREGQRLIAHELAHVVQQSAGASPAPTGPDLAVSRPGDSLEVAANTMAGQAIAGQPVAAAQASAPAVQREAAEEEEEQPPPEEVPEEEEME